MLRLRSYAGELEHGLGAGLQVDRRAGSDIALRSAREGVTVVRFLPEAGLLLAFAPIDLFLLFQFLGDLVQRVEAYLPRLAIPLGVAAMSFLNARGADDMSPVSAQ